MPVPWIDSVKKSNQLTVFPTSAVTGGLWANVFTKALQEFNLLSTRMKLGVTMIPSTSKPEPGLGGANVNFDVASGTVSFKIITKEFSVNVNGQGMIGHTERVMMSNDKDQLVMVKAFIFMPSTPMINAGPAGQQVRRGVGDGLKLVIAVHELVHACGLGNQDHSTDSNPDLFLPQLQPDAGKTPGDDRARIRLQPTVFAPPIFLSARTAGLIQSNWK